MHGSQAYEYRRPPREGETLRIRARIESIRHKGGTGFLTIAMDLVDREDELVCAVRSQMLERGPQA